MKKPPFPPSLFDNDCDRPACADTLSALNAAMKHSKQQNTKNSPNEINSNLKLGQSSPESMGCPPLSEELGRGSWKLLHSMAAWYPDYPTEEDQKAMQFFIAGLAKFYPCTYCATDFQTNIQDKPVRTKTRKDLCQWICEQHNIVNKKLNKPMFSCKMEDLDERWRKSSNPHCNE